MIKKFIKAICLCALIMLSIGCQKASKSQVSNQQKETGYDNLADLVYIKESLLDQLPESVHSYEGNKFDVNRIKDNLSTWLGPETVVEEKTYDRSLEYHLLNKDKMIFLMSSMADSALSVTLSTPEGNLLDSLFYYYENINKIQFDWKHEVTKDESENKVREAIDSFFAGLGIEVEYSLSTQSIKKDQFGIIFKQIQETFDSTEYPAEMLQLEPSDFVVAELRTKKDDHLMISKDTHLGSTDQVNVISGTTMRFLLKDGQIVYANLTQLRIPGRHSEAPVVINKKRIIEGLKAKFDELLISDKSFIDQVDIEYAPIYQDQGAGSLYTDYEFRPLLKFMIRSSEFPQKFFIDPETGKEVN